MAELGDINGKLASMMAGYNEQVARIAALQSRPHPLEVPDMSKYNELMSRRANAPLETNDLLEEQGVLLSQQSALLKEMVDTMRTMAETIEFQREAAAEPKHEWRAKYNTWVLGVTALLTLGGLIVGIVALAKG